MNYLVPGEERSCSTKNEKPWKEEQEKELGFKDRDKM
jgi:hypothetical protein